MCFSKSLSFSKYPLYLNFLKAKFSIEYSPSVSKPDFLNFLIFALRSLISSGVVALSAIKSSI